MLTRPIDVMTPVFNGAPFIRESIESILRQTYRNLRLIVVNNGSTDGTADVLAELAAQDNRIMLVTQAHTSLVEARNRQLEMATGDLISFQDADDISEPDRLQKQVDYLIAYPECVGVSGAGRHIDAQGSPTGDIVRFRPPEDSDPTWLPAREPNLMPFTVMRRAAVQAAGGFRHVFHADDTDLYWRLRRLGSLVNLPDIVGSYRLHAGSDTGRSIQTTRIMAMMTELSALSAARADRGEPEIVFDLNRYATYRSVGSMAGIYEQGCEGLSRAEADHLRLGYASKALQLLELRHQTPDVQDCRFIHDAYQHYPVANQVNRRELRRVVTVIGARLLRDKLVREVWTLTPTPYAVEALARAVLGRV